LKAAVRDQTRVFAGYRAFVPFVYRSHGVPTTNPSTVDWLNAPVTCTIIGAILGALLGTVTASIGFFVSRWWDGRCARNEADTRYRNLLIAVLRELGSYLGVLGTLVQQLAIIEKHCTPGCPEYGKPPFIPSYDLDASFLERMKYELATCNRNSKVEQAIWDCHFELSHIGERLGHLKLGRVADKEDLARYGVNVSGFRQLVLSGQRLFAKTMDLVNRTIDPKNHSPATQSETKSEGT
jgi:hypothetical protein